MDKYGLTKGDIHSICKVLRNYPSVDEAILFGSRAMGNYTSVSDIDLSLLGENITLSELFAIENDIDDLILSNIVDLNIYRRIKNQELLDHLRRVGTVFYVKHKQNAVT